MIQIIPAIDIIDGACVRLTQGDYARKKNYSSSPLDIARQFEDAGIRRLHLVDLDGAKAARPCNLAVLEQIVSHTALAVEFGGGIKSADSLSQVFDAGATYAICGSIAVTDPEGLDDWIRRFGGQHIILGVDVKQGKVATHGWLKTSELGAEELIARFPDITQVICTDIASDGMLQGVNQQWYVDLQHRFPNVDVVVSGGISGMDDIRGLDAEGLRAVIVGKAFYEGRITIDDLKAYVG